MHDITLPMKKGMIAYPGDAPFSISFLREERLSPGAATALSKLSLSSHAGTHLDFPFHFVRSGGKLGDFPPESFFLPATVIETWDENVVDETAIESVRLDPGSAVLFKTPNTHRRRLDRPDFENDFTEITPRLAERLVERSVALVGLDYLSVERARKDSYPVHQTLLGHGILILEGADLDGVRPGDYELICLPLRIPEAEASPVRALLRERPA